jgi:hypothetical protein
MAELYPRALRSLYIKSSYFVTDYQSASLSWCLIWSPWPDFCFLSDKCGFLDVGRTLWREDGSVIYSYKCSWALPEQLLSSPSPAEHDHIFYGLIWEPPTWRARSPYSYPPGTGWTTYTPRHRVSFSSPLTTLRATAEVKVKGILWTMVSRQACLRLRHPSGTSNQSFFSSL